MRQEALGMGTDLDSLEGLMALAGRNRESLKFLIEGVL